MSGECSGIVLTVIKTRQAIGRTGFGIPRKTDTQKGE